MPREVNLRCWFGSHAFVLDETNSGRKFCARCGMKSLLMIAPGMHNGKFRAGGGNYYWQDISFPEEGFWGLRHRFRMWRFHRKSGL
jgi:hypothetical protein